MQLFLSLFFLFITAQTLTFAQDAPDTQTDTSSKSMGKITREVRLKEGSLTTFVLNNLPDTVRSYISVYNNHGKAFITLTINEQGTVTQAWIAKGKYSFVDNSLLELLRNTQWIPAMSDGKLVTVIRTIPISY